MVFQTNQCLRAGMVFQTNQCLSQGRDGISNYLDGAGGYRFCLGMVQFSVQSNGGSLV